PPCCSTSKARSPRFPKIRRSRAGVETPGAACRVCVRFLQRAHILVNEAAAQAGRGQAIAPTMDELLWVIQRSIVGAMACPRPGAHAKIVRAPLHASSSLFIATRGSEPSCSREPLPIKQLADVL